MRLKDLVESEQNFSLISINKENSHESGGLSFLSDTKNKINLHEA